MPTSYSTGSKAFVVVTALFVVGFSASPANARGTGAETKAETQLRPNAVTDQQLSAEPRQPPRRPE